MADKKIKFGAGVRVPVKKKFYSTPAFQGSIAKRNAALDAAAKN